MKGLLNLENYPKVCRMNHKNLVFALGCNSGRILRLFNCNDRVFFAIAGCAKAKMSTYFSKLSLPGNV